MKVKKQSSDELRPEYDFDYSKATRGKYYRRLELTRSTKRLTKRSIGSLKIQAHGEC